MCDAKFLSPSQVLIGFRPEERKYPYLSVINLRESAGECSYELPLFTDELERLRIVVSPAARYHEAEAGPFMRESPAWDVDCSLDICALEVEGWRDSSSYAVPYLFLVVIIVKSLQKHLSTSQYPRSPVSWKEWGPSSTRWFPRRTSRIRASIYGSQLFWKIPSDWLTHPAPGAFEARVDRSEESKYEPLHTVLIDFNSRRIKQIDISDNTYTEAAIGNSRCLDS